VRCATKLLPDRILDLDFADRPDLGRNDGAVAPCSAGDAVESHHGHSADELCAVAGLVARSAGRLYARLVLQLRTTKPGLSGRRVIQLCDLAQSVADARLPIHTGAFE